MARKWIEQGESIRLYVDYVDTDTGEPVDPMDLTCSVQLPNGTTRVIEYPSTDFQRESQGFFFVRILGDIVGTFTYKIHADLNVNDKDVRFGKFDVEGTF